MDTKICLPEFTMTQKVYFYAPKCTFNPDHGPLIHTH